MYYKYTRTTSVGTEPDVFNSSRQLKTHVNTVTKKTQTRKENKRQWTGLGG